ncbi:MAG TPA: excinuclease ABC subunit UvrA [Myxococcota bacterium]|nr:excinuclease ABC subunit UvrA [Myxococcota bacterium]
MAGISNILVKGARVHNLKNIDVALPRNQLIVITGLSGSGKSSLAFDTIYAEGQRRYVESLSSYARQFLKLQDKPDVDLIEGLSPAISIEQKTTSKNPRSTVATVTEIYDYLRLLFARVGQPYCYECHKPIAQKSATAITDEIMGLGLGTRISLLAPMVRAKKGEHKAELAKLQKEGFVRVRVDGELRYLEEDIELNPKTKHSIDLVIDRIVLDKNESSRLSDAVELALKKSGGLVTVLKHEGDKITEELFSEHFGCIDCGVSFPEIEPRMFSFNAPQGACPSCNGLGNFLHFTEDKIIRNPELSLNQGVISPYAANIKGYYYSQIFSVAKAFDASLDLSWRRLPKKVRDAILNGTDQRINFVFKADSSKRTHRFTRVYEGLINQLARRYKETDNETIREELENYMSREICPECHSARVGKEARSVKIDHRAINDVSDMTIKEAVGFFAGLSVAEKHQVIAQPILKEIGARLSFLEAVGLDYLTLSRTSRTLSGGEAQRIRLATQIGSALVGVLYVLDEPSIGLHQRDNEKLLATLKNLRDLGNTVLVVEHDEDTILASDYVVDMGPGAGTLGGEIVACGTPKAIMKNKKSLTARYLSRDLIIKTPKNRRVGQHFMTLKNARGNNLTGVDLKIPLGTMTAVTGVSGSGKSSLIIDTLYAELSRHYYGSGADVLPHDGITGLQFIDKVIDIDQSPIGRTPRSNPVTYAGIFDGIRDLFASLPDAQMRGFDSGRFSFNVKGGRCEACKGGGVVRIEMNFLPDVYVTCDECKGKRFNKETLSVTYKDKTIADVLEMTVADALSFFSAIPQINRKLMTLSRVGLGYIHLGQQATTLSGGEAQRIKLSKELSKRATGKTLYILDEPTTGLHFHDVSQLLDVLHELVDQGNTVLVIEHNLDVIKSSDHVIDLGPEGGKKGGKIIATGTPEEIAANTNSHTGHFLKKALA